MFHSRPGSIVKAGSSFTMKKQTVKKRIFVSNTCMVLTTLVIFLIINTIVMGGYWEYVEQEMNNSMEFTVNGEELEEIVAEFTLRRNEFLLLFLADGILCIAVLVGVSQLFTKNLAEHMMEPLNVLAEGGGADPEKGSVAGRPVYGRRGI